MTGAATSPVVTIEDLNAAGLAQGDDEVAVYLPMSYQIGGYTLLLPRRCLTPLEMGFEDAMRFVITAGLSRPEHDHAGTAARGR